MNQFLLLSMRFLHIFGGFLWVGAAVVYFFFIQPSVKALGPASGKLGLADLDVPT